MCILICRRWKHRRTVGNGELYRRGYQDGNTTPLFRVNQPESVLQMNKRNYGSFNMMISGGSVVDRERSVYERAFVCIR